MKTQRLSHACIAIAILFIPFVTVLEASALERWLVPNTSQCPADPVTNPCHTTLVDAVNNAAAGDSIRILPRSTPYTAANIILTKNITIYGVETARTFVTGNGSAAFTVSGVTALMDIRNLTFTTSSPAIIVQNNSTQINIKNNVFQAGSAATAIQVNDSSSPVIMNNTFYENGTAISSIPNSLSLINNIFSGNGLAISSNVTIDNIQNNLFWQNTNIGPLDIIFNSGDANYKGNINDVDIDSLFVDPLAGDITQRDFHLTAPTPAGNTTAGANSIDGTSPPDMGAYGGSGSDTVPFPVSDLAITGTTSSTISLSWSPNNCYFIGGYKVSYGSLSGEYTTTFDAGNVTTYDISGLTPASPPTGAPIITSYDIASNTLVLYWDTNPVSNATGYEVRYDTAGVPTAASPSKDAGNSNSFALTGLTNDTYYYVNVTAYAQSTFFIAVQAYYAANPATFVSDYSNEVESSIGTKSYSATSSTEIYDYPEKLVPHPNLKNTGCFIATAAYGYYSAPQVQALRNFRDEYLLTNKLGKAFVQLYYRYGPIGAQFINEHPTLKPAVRIALLPAVGGALFMTKTSMIGKSVVLIFLLLVTGYLIRKIKLRRSGGCE